LVGNYETFKREYEFEESREGGRIDHNKLDCMKLYKSQHVIWFFREKNHYAQPQTDPLCH